jgi:hypothetical protein
MGQRIESTTLCFNQLNVLLARIIRLPITQRFLVLSIMDNVKSKLEFYKLEMDANKLRLVGMDKNRHCGTRMSNLFAYAILFRA